MIFASKVHFNCTFLSNIAFIDKIFVNSQYIHKSGSDIRYKAFCDDNFPLTIQLNQPFRSFSPEFIQLAFLEITQNYDCELVQNYFSVMSKNDYKLIFKIAVRDNFQSHYFL